MRHTDDEIPKTDRIAELECELKREVAREMEKLKAKHVAAELGVLVLLEPSLSKCQVEILGLVALRLLIARELAQTLSMPCHREATAVR